MKPSRRSVLQGALVVGFSAAVWPARGQEGGGTFATTASHIDAGKLDSWLRIDADGAITVYTGKCDFGQGMLTAQTQLAAEELCVPLSRVTLVACDTDVCPDQGTTSGSQSTPTNFNAQNLALAAATARETLLAMAAKVLGEPVAALTAADGFIVGKTRRVSYAELIGNKHFNIPLNHAAKRKPKSQWTILGKPVNSIDRPQLMTGHFEYVHNIRVPGMLHGRVVRPPQIGATVASVDEASVKSLPGNVKLVVRKDFVGVVADKQFQAINAARALQVKWNSAPPLPKQDVFHATMQTMPSHDAIFVDSQGVPEALSAARQVVKARYTWPFHMHGSLASSCAVADVKKDSVALWSATQSAYPTRSCVATILNVPLESVRLIYTRSSGCYGLNGNDAVTFDAAVLSQGVGRPVRLQYTRQDEMLSENYGSACVIEQRAALDGDAIVAWDREDWVVAHGNRPGYNRPGNVISGMLMGYEAEPVPPAPAKPPKGKLNNNSNTVPAYFSGCIDGNCDGGGTIKHERVITHTVKSPFFTGPLRSPLRIQNTLANECFMDEMCVAAKADPVAFRLKHLNDPRVIGVLKRVAEMAKWQTAPLAAPARVPAGIARGRGVAAVAYEGHNGYCALVCDVEVDMATGVIHPVRFFAALDAGPVSNPDGLRNQSEGGILQGTSRTLVEEVRWNDTRVISTDWVSYPSLRLGYAIPEIICDFVEPEGVPATGAGETAITVTPAAIGNAVFAATGVRMRDAPFTPARFLAALHKASA